MGIIGTTKQLAMEGRAHGIRANSISPGIIETDQTTSLQCILAVRKQQLERVKF